MTYSKVDPKLYYNFQIYNKYYMNILIKNNQKYVIILKINKLFNNTLL